MDIVQERLRARIRHGPDHDRADRRLPAPAARRHPERDRKPVEAADLSRVEEIREPIITTTMLMPQEYVGPVITLCTERRGVQKNMQYLGRQVMLTYELPLAEVVMDFFDR
jgi:translation elongation factor EF-4